LQGDACQATRDNGDFLAVVKAIGAKIDVASGHALRRGIVGRNDRKRNDRLRNVVARLGDNSFTESLDFGAGGAGAHEHTVAAGFADALDDQVGEIGENVGEMVGAIAKIGIDAA